MPKLEKRSKWWHKKQQCGDKNGDADDHRHQVVFVPQSGEYGIIERTVDQRQEDIGTCQNGEDHGAGG